MQCSECGFENPDGMKYCGQCASQLIPLCPHCQFENPPNFKFCGNCGESLKNSAAIAGIAGNRPVSSDIIDRHTIPSHDQAERRQLTVLFCDVVGSTALSEHIDPEDLRDIMGEYRDTCQSVVARFNGHIAQYLGDGVLVYFGYPSANEDDATRAVQTGINLINSVNELNRKFSRLDVNLSIRVGIHTGLVVIGEIGTADKRSMALGTTPNIAARLQDLAKPNNLVISDSTYRLVHNKFNCKNMGEHSLKGFSHKISLYCVDCIDTRTDLNRKDQNAYEFPMIGREQESALILDRLNEAKQGQGQVVLLSGEAGIGKSRLTHFLREQVCEDSMFLFESWGSPYHKNSFLHSVTSVINDVLELDQYETAEEKLKELETPLAVFGIPLAETVPLIAELLMIPVPKGRYPVKQYSPQQRKQKILEALLGLLFGIASQRMVVIILEDLHWVDPTTIEFLSMIIDQAPASNVFMLLTYRLEFTPPWTPRSHITQISINRLTRKQAGRMVRLLANNKELPVPIFNEIVSKTDGTPFFVEELTKMVLESDLLKETHEHYELAGPLSNLAIPSTLQDSLMAKLDRLGSAKELAQMCATLGREFAHSVLKAVADSSYTDLDYQLSQLVFHELLYQRGLPPKATYTFRHALVHEVAYQSLLKKTRQKFHRKIAEVLASQFPEKIEENPEIMAHHCFEAGDYDSSVQYWLRAGQMAIQRSANSDATVHLHNGINALEKTSPKFNRAELELQLQASMGLAYMLLKGYAANEVQSAYGRAYAISRNIGKSTATFPILCGLWEFYLVRCELDTAKELALHLQTIAADTSGNVYKFEAQRALGSTAFWRGDLENANRYLHIDLPRNKTSTSAAEQDRSPIYGHDTEVATLGTVACVHWLMGQTDRSLENINRALILADELKHPFSIVYATYFSAIIHQLRGDARKAKTQAQIAIELSKKYDFAFWRDTTKFILLWAKQELGESGDHIADYEKILEIYQKTGSKLALTYFNALLANMHIRAGKLSEADAIIDDTIARLSTHQEYFFKAEIYRLKGVLLEKQYQQNSSIAADDIIAAYQTSLNCAQEQGASSLELRAAVNLGEFLLSLDMEKQAHDTLKPIFDNIEEGKDTQDWQAANELLEKTKSTALSV